MPNSLHIDQLQALISVLISLFLGAIIGLDREIANKPAGLRTHMLVTGAAALLVSLSQHLIHEMETKTAAATMGIIRLDPSRIIESVITGVSFIGAGTIIQRRNSEGVGGLTTAATLLFSASIGVSVALGERLLAIAVTALAIAILRIPRIVGR